MQNSVSNTYVYVLLPFCVSIVNIWQKLKI